MALAEGINVRDLPPRRDGDVVLGEDFVAPDNIAEDELRAKRARRGMFSLRKSSLTRKIVTFNLIALNVLVAGILYLNSSRDEIALQHAKGLVGMTELAGSVLETQMPGTAPVNLMTGDGVDVQATLDNLSLDRGLQLLVFDTQGQLVGQVEGTKPRPLIATEPRPTLITDTLARFWTWMSAPFGEGADEASPGNVEDNVRGHIAATLQSGTRAASDRFAGDNVYIVTTPVLQGDVPVGVVAIVSATGEIDNLVRAERERVLQMFIIATLVSIGLSLILASTIANPISDLAAAAEIAGDRNRSGKGGRIRIPDLTARPDEIGRLSGALRGMVAALHHRIDANEQFAADVAHEIKNPLASLRSAVGTMRVAKREDQRERLLEVIEHDVRRLDRLVSDISNASRLDSELVKEEQEPFDLLIMLRNLGQFLGEDANKRGIDFITDFPDQPLILTGLEGRLAQVFVNLITNAISFCEEGDAIRVWVRRRENRVLVVVEDTGPGIPEGALTKIFKRFYSHRSESEFGNNSGLGLAISKQIVEAHDGVIWAENIRPTDADITSDPLGARFVVGLPV